MNQIQIQPSYPLYALLAPNRSAQAAPACPDAREAVDAILLREATAQRPLVTMRT